jgi:hypothetical protein
MEEALLGRALRAGRNTNRNRTLAGLTCAAALACFTVATVNGMSPLAPLLVASDAKLGPLKPLRAQLGASHACPGSPSLVHAKCKITVRFEQPCAVVEKVMAERVGAVHDCKTKPGTYKGTWRLGSRTTGDGKYVDKFKNSLAPDDGGGCTLTACSESQSTSVLDYSTNYCNLFNLYGANSSSNTLTFVERTDSCGQHERSLCCR